MDDEDVEDEEEWEWQEGVKGGINPWPDVVKEIHMLVVRQATTALCDGRGEEKVEVFGDADDDDGGGDDAGIAYRAYEGSL